MNTLAVSSRLFFLLTRPIKMEETGCSETSAHKIQKPGNHPKERIQYSEHGESLKSRISVKYVVNLLVIRCKYLQKAQYAQVTIKHKLFAVLNRLCPVPCTGFLISQYI